MITAYHRVNPWHKEDALTVSPGNFERQMRYLLKRGFIPVQPDDYLSTAGTGDSSSALLTTFDDGYADNLWYAAPVLGKLGVKPLIFLTVNYIGTVDIFRRYKDKEKDRFLNWREVGELSAEGAVFGSHSLSHPHLPQVDDGTLRTEIAESKKIIEDRIGRPVNFFCCPYGDFDERVIGALQGAGYLGAVVTPGVGKRVKKSVYTLPRTGVYGHNGFLIFRTKIWKDYLTEKYF